MAFALGCAWSSPALADDTAPPPTDPDSKNAEKQARLDKLKAEHDADAKASETYKAEYASWEELVDGSRSSNLILGTISIVLGVGSAVPAAVLLTNDKDSDTPFAAMFAGCAVFGLAYGTYLIATRPNKEALIEQGRRGAIGRPLFTF